MANELLMAHWAQVTLGVVLAILILLAMITVHEFGHYLAGKILKFRINEFSIGFGPAIFKRRSKKTGELFAVRLIPLGGYCAFDGEDGLEDETKKGPTVSETEASVSQTQTDGAPSEALPSDSPNREHAARRGGKFTAMAPWKRIVVLVAGATMNYLLALVLILILFASFGQSLVKVRGAEVSEEYPAEYSFRAGDVLLQADGRNLYLTTDIAQALNGKKAGDLVEFRVARETEGGMSEVIQPIMLRADVQVKNSTQLSGVWKALGVGIEERDGGRYYMLTTEAYRFGFFETIGRSFAYSFKLAGSIFRVLGELLTGKLGIDALGGPVTTIAMTSQIAASGVQNFLEISAYIGVNLAVFNLLPIPALDGSKVVFTAIEWIRGKPISRKVEAIIHAAGFILLLGFAVLVDILQFV